MEFTSLNDAMNDYKPADTDLVRVNYIDNVTLTTKINPGVLPGGSTSAGKPASVVDVFVSSIYGNGGKAFLPITLYYNFSRNELADIFGQVDADRILANPAANSSLLFSKLSIQKEISSGGTLTCVNLVPGTLSPESAMIHGLLKLEGGGRLAISFSFLACDSEGPAHLDVNQ